MLQLRNDHLDLTAFCFFCGLGGLSLGLANGHAREGRATATIRSIGGIDQDPAAARDFATLTGSPCAVMDLFDAEQYEAFHGEPPPAGWREVTPADVLAAAGGRCPDILATSPPCKGFSGLLSTANAESDRYAALNMLVLRGLMLALEAFKDDLPSLILLENVPRIQTRGRHLLDLVRGLLEGHGYAVAETSHDCGELGGLAQHRHRFLMVARLRSKVRPFLYEPPKRRVLGVGEVLESLPFPNDEAAGPMHRLPRLTWRTVVRLALIPAGRDWRALRDLAVVDGYLKDIGIVPEGWGNYHALMVRPWDKPCATVTGKAAPGNGYNVADPRPTSTHGGSGKYRVTGYSEPSGTVIGSSTTGQGSFAVADPMPGNTRGGGRRFNNVYRVVDWNERSPAVTGGTGPSAGGLSVADPLPARWRKRRRNYESGGHYGIVAWDESSPTVVGNAKHDKGRSSVADPRFPASMDDQPLDFPVVISLDNTWHRPFTTMELMALQGFPIFDIAGQPIELDGNNHEHWRMRIGNAVPPPTAAAIGCCMARTLLLEALDVAFVLSSEPVWVHPLAAALSADLPSMIGVC